VSIEIREAETEDRIRSMLDATPLACTFRDEKYRIIDCNLEAVKLFGVSDKAEFIKQYYTFSPELQPSGGRSADLREQVFRDILETGYKRLEWTYLTAAGEMLPMEVIGVRIPWKDSFRLLIYSRDLREAKANEQKIREANRELREAKERAETALLQAEYYNKAKSDFLSRMSHEMRTPLNAIMGMTGITRNTEDPARRNACLYKIDESSRHLLGIINNVLDMAHLDTGKFVLEPGTFSFREMFGRVYETAALPVKAKSQRFSVTIAEDIPDLVLADEKRLREVLLHLLSNSVKFTPENGSISVSASLVRPGPECESSLSACTIQFEVADTGKGISREQQERLFYAFEQADNSITREYGGTGLGMAIAKNIVELMGGKIRVESETGKGSTFIFTVPVKKVNNKDKNFNTVGNEVSLNLSGKHLLIVDDVEINRDILLALLENSGAAVSAACSGAEAIRIFSEGGCDLILMDIHMPDMDGIEAARQIRRLEDTGSLRGARARMLGGSPAEVPHVPVIAVTADTSGDMLRRCMSAGMNDRIAKPVDFDALLGTVKKYLSA
jgi:signal transduction histidine kinase/CheY-like chemotaxis protein